MFDKKPTNKYRETTYEKEERRYFGFACPVCDRPLSQQRPICFACPIHPLEYYEKKEENRNKNQI
jgi:hypothetical protein